MDASDDKDRWRPGERLLLDDEGHREVTVEEVCGDRVCCRWQQAGVLRRSWIDAARLRRIAHPMAQAAAG